MGVPELRESPRDPLWPESLFEFELPNAKSHADKPVAVLDLSWLGGDAGGASASAVGAAAARAASTAAAAVAATAAASQAW